MSEAGEKPVSSPPQGSGEASSPPEPAFLAVGRVLRPHGLHGEVRIEIHTDYPERFALHKWLYLGPAHVPYALQSCRFHQGAVLLKFAGIEDRAVAETLRGQWVWIPREEAVPLEEGECYQYQMYDLQVWTVEGEELGRVTEIIEAGPHDVYVVQGTKGEVLLPDIEEVVVKVDVQARRMLVRLIEGLR